MPFRPHMEDKTIGFNYKPEGRKMDRDEQLMAKYGNELLRRMESEENDHCVIRKGSAECRLGTKSRKKLFCDNVPGAIFITVTKNSRTSHHKEGDVQIKRLSDLSIPLGELV